MSRRKWMTSKPPCLLKVQLQAAMTFSVLWKELETKVPVCFGTACYFGHVGENRYQRILRNKRKTFELQPKAWAGREGHLDSREQWKVGKHTKNVSSAKQAGPMGLGQEAKVSVGNRLCSRQASLIAVCPSVKSGPQARRFTCFACSGRSQNSNYSWTVF